MIILGINAWHADASAALLMDGMLAAAVEEERLTRVKHAAGFPVHAIRECLRIAGVAPHAIDHIAISRNPRAHALQRIAANLRKDFRTILSRAANAGRLLDLPAAVADALQIPKNELRARMHAVEHHRSHMASAFFVSPFSEAAVLSIDGLGDYCSAMWGEGIENQLQVNGCVEFPHSLGFFYTACTQLLGFLNYGDEYKVMGLSAFGEPRMKEALRQVVSVRDDGQIRLNLDYFIHHTRGDAMTWDEGVPRVGALYSPRMAEEFGPARRPNEELLDRHRDLAASVQAVLEECILKLLRVLQHQTRRRAVCLAGGVALNCVANGKIREHTNFEDVYVQPAAADSGTALGAALFVRHQTLRHPRRFVMDRVSYGSEWTGEQVERELARAGAVWRRYDEVEMIRNTARQIADGGVVGWFQGRMEFGPRALGNRSILADPRRADMKDILNLRIKYREPFRPFCPSILAEAASEYFEQDYPSPFMVMAYSIRPEKRAQVPAITHVDGTGRLQMVTEAAAPHYYRLIRAFADLTGVPILLNTSFNENEPIVATPSQAIDCFLRTHMDVLAIGNCLLLKSENRETARRARAALAD